MYGTQQTFFEKYSDALYYGPMMLGGLASFMVALWKFVGGNGNRKEENALAPLYGLAAQIREARSESRR